MKMFVQLCVLCVVVFLGTDASVFFERNTKDKYNTGMCFSTVFQQSIKVGKSYPTPNCGEMFCDEDYIISYAGCISGDIPKDCVETEQVKKLSYPACCPINYCFEDISENQDEGSLII